MISRALRPNLLLARAYGSEASSASSGWGGDVGGGGSRCVCVIVCGSETFLGNIPIDVRQELAVEGAEEGSWMMCCAEDSSHKRTSGSQMGVATESEFQSSQGPHT